MRKWALVAEVVKTKTLEGGLVVQGTTGPSFLLQVGMEIALVPPRIGFPRTGIVEEIRPYKSTSYVVNIDSINDIDTAEAMLGCSILAKREELPDPVKAEEEDALGYLVVDDKQGELGVIVEIITERAQALLRVEGRFGEVLIPYVFEIAYDLDSNTRVLSTRIPHGLLDTASKMISSE